LTGDSKKTDYVIDGDVMSMTTGSTTHTCKRVSPDDVPAWLESELAKAFQVMDQKEAELNAAAKTLARCA
jgi:hypothetical protein